MHYVNCAHLLVLSAPNFFIPATWDKICQQNSLLREVRPVRIQFFYWLEFFFLHVHTNIS